VATVSALALSACTTTTFTTRPGLNRGTAGLRVLLMPMDIELSLLSAGGVAEPNAEWTAQAQQNVTATVSRILKERGAQLITYNAPTNPDPLHPHVQLVKLHNAVGGSVLLHKINPVLKLPNKAEVFDWTLGKGVRQLKNEFGADYAMFLFMRDSYTSGGRAVAMILAGVLLGVALPGGQQIVFASLVDLDSGDLVWFNYLARGDGDLRTPVEAEETVLKLFTNLPK